MIQLDSTAARKFAIHLEGYEGIGEGELVKNGDFSELGSDLVQNGDFAQIGSELVTNGDFSATGSNLITNPNFTDTGSEQVPDGAPVMSGSWLGSNTVSGGQLTKTGVGLSYKDNVDLSVAKSWKVVVDVAEKNGSGLTFYLGGLQPTLNAGVNTLYLVNSTLNNYIGVNNGDGSIINSISVKELGEDWSVGTGWSIGENKATVDDVSTALLSQSSLSVVTGKSYKISLEVSNLVAGSELQIEFSAGNIVGNVTTNGEFTFYDVWGVSAILYLYALGTSDFSVSNVTLQEVGQNWTIVGSDATHYVEFPGVGARYVSGSTSPQLWLRQDGIITPGKSYTVTCNVAYASGSGAVKAYVGGDESSSLAEGFNTVTLTATTGSNFAITRNASNVDCVITNVTLTQVGGGNLERWWRMNGSQGPTAAPPAPADYITANKAPNGIVNIITPTGSPLLDQDTP